MKKTNYTITITPDTEIENPSNKNPAPILIDTDKGIEKFTFNKNNQHEYEDKNK